jgi:tetratricopeptide (TPR) repeat protein
MGCSGCTTPILPHVLRCHVCGADVGFPNVRAADAASEQAALTKRLDDAKVSAKARTCLAELDDFGVAVATSKAVLARSVGDLDAFVKSDTLLGEALVEYDLCEFYGDAQFAATGRARVLRYQGFLEEALAAFRNAQTLFSGHQSEPFAWAGSAETLRDMWKFDDALEEYEKAIARFPDKIHLQCGRAAVLSDLGKLELALQAYEVPQLRGDLIAQNGRATVLRELGRLDEALTAVKL